MLFHSLGPWFMIALLLGVGLAGCGPSNPNPLDGADLQATTRTRQPAQTDAISTARTSLPVRNEATAATQSPAPTTTPLPRVVGPLDYPDDVNPLTGLKLDHPETLQNAPILVSVTNFPPSARPQAGLSIASQVWETSIGQGMTRFLAVFNGEYKQDFAQLAGEAALDNPYDFVIGPVRSGRIGFEEIKGFYPSARLLIRYASPEVIGRLSNWELVTASNFEDINSAGLSFDELQSLQVPTVESTMEGGLAFDERPPSPADPGDELQIFYNIYNRVRWEYSADRGQYLRFQDASDGSEELLPTLDRLTGKQLGFENIVVLWAYHRYENIQGTILELGLRYMPDGYGLLFRDGSVQQIHWSTLGDRLSLRDEDGDPVLLRPGRTFFEVVSQFSTWDDDTNYVRFYNPVIPTATATMTPTITVTPPAGTPTATEVP